MLATSDNNIFWNNKTMVKLNKIYTRTGDSGETSLVNGRRVSKHARRPSAFGEIDEANSVIGLARLHCTENQEADNMLARIQNDLFDLGGGLAFPGAPLLSQKHVARLDAAAEDLNADLPPLKEFILPGGAPSVAVAHVARASARRVERAMAAFLRDAPEAAHGLQYLNRLSDVLFIVARVEARHLGAAEIYWRT